jgi:hypothetical protein
VSHYCGTTATHQVSFIFITYRHLLPDVYVEISRRVAYAPASKLIHWAENNPVVAAYGVAHSLESGMENISKAGYGDKVRTPNLEWDVFLDPYKVAEVEAVLAERDKFLSSILPLEYYSFYETHKPLGLSIDDWLEAINEAAVKSGYLGASIVFTETQRQILKYYADQLEARAGSLVDAMLIAHGKLTHLVYEQLGLAKKFNCKYSSSFVHYTRASVRCFKSHCAFSI